MGKLWRPSWSSLSPLTKKRLLQGAAVYLVFMASAAAWVATQHGHTLAQHEAGSAQARAVVRVVQPPVEAGLATEAPAPAGRIALIMSDLGLAKETDTKAINDLPAEVAFAFSPYGQYSQSSAAAAREEGHAVVALLPMESNRPQQEDAGPLTLSTRLSDAQKQQTMERVLASMPKPDAAMNYQGSRFLGSAPGISVVLKQLHKDHILFVENPSGPSSTVRSVAQAENMPVATIDVPIDDTTTQDAIRSQLEELERIGRERGIAIGLVHGYPLTFSQITAWLGKLPNRQIELVTLQEASKLQALPLPALPSQQEGGVSP